MKKILCFGDSNTFGYIPENGQRYDKSTRWAGILATQSPEQFKVTEAGCNNRTAYAKNPEGNIFTGRDILPEYLKTQYDCVILALGLNDLQTQYNSSLEDVKTGLETLIEIIRTNNPTAEILITSPSVIREELLNSGFSLLFDPTSIEKSHEFARIYKYVAEEKNCHFMDFNEFVQASPIDGLHYDKKAHKLIAEKLFHFLLTLYPQQKI